MWLRQLYYRFQHLVHELGKFGLVGGAAYAVDSVILIALGERDWEPITAKIIATVIAATIAFVGNRFWTWRHRARSGLAREYTLYFVFNTLGLGIALACLGITHYWLGAFWPAVFQTTLALFISANVVGLVLGTVFRFWSYRRYVFRQVVTTELSVATTPSREH